jgi:hypothetical protein
MSDDRIQQGLDAYAEHLQRGTGPAPAAEIRRRAGRRRRNQAVAATFAAVLIAGAGLGAVLNRPSGPAPLPADPSPSVSVSPTTSPSPGPSRTGSAESNVDQLQQIGVDLETGVLLDFSDDGLDHWMRVGPDEVVDFAGDTKDASTEMSLIPAPVTGRNRVLVVPVARPGFCVAATPEPPLVLQPCREGDRSQTWRIVPAGDSGLFNLEGRYGVVAVDEQGMIPYAQGGGWSGMQTIRFTG